MNLKRLWVPAVLLAVGLLANWLRLDVVESPRFAQMCQGHGATALCLGREWLVQGFLLHLPGTSKLSFYGSAALLATLWTMASRRSWVALLAASLGMLALQLYSAECGALALLAGLLRLLHLQARTTAEAPAMQANSQARQ